MLPTKTYSYFTDRNGIRIYENTVPTGTVSDKLPWVFVHGMAGGALNFAPWLQYCEALAVKAYSIELPYHHNSKVEDLIRLGKTSIPKYTDDVSRIITEEIGDCVAVGWSMGGLILQKVAPHNRCVKKLVLVASAAPAGIFIRGKILLRMLRPSYIWAMITCKPFRFTRKDTIDLMLNVGFTPIEQEQFCNDQMAESGRAARDIATWQVPAEMIPCPVLCVGAEKDKMTPVSMQREIARKYNATYIEIKDAAHAILLQPYIEKVAFDKILQWVKVGSEQLATVS